MTFIRRLFIGVTLVASALVVYAATEPTTGIKVGAPILPNGGFPTHIANNGFGGWHIANSTNDVATNSLTPGTAVLELSSGKIYIYSTNNVWQPFMDGSYVDLVGSNLTNMVPSGETTIEYFDVTDSATPGINQRYTRQNASLYNSTNRYNFYKVGAYWMLYMAGSDGGSAGDVVIEGAANNYTYPWQDSGWAFHTAQGITTTNSATVVRNKLDVPSKQEASAAVSSVDTKLNHLIGNLTNSHVEVNGESFEYDTGSFYNPASYKMFVIDAGRWIYSDTPDVLAKYHNTSGVTNSTPPSFGWLDINNEPVDFHPIFYQESLSKERAERISEYALKLNANGGILTGPLRVLYGTNYYVDCYSDAKMNSNLGLGCGIGSTSSNTFNLGLDCGQNASGENNLNIGGDAGSFGAQTNCVNLGILAGKNAKAHNQVSIGTAAGRYGTNDFGVYIENFLPAAYGGTLTPTNAAMAKNGAFYLNGTTGELFLGRPSGYITLRGTILGVTKSTVGLSNVNNTSDANKPVSTATQNALNGLASEYVNITGSNLTNTVPSGELTIDYFDVGSCMTPGVNQRYFRQSADVYTSTNAFNFYKSGVYWSLYQASSNGGYGGVEVFSDEGMDNPYPWTYTGWDFSISRPMTQTTSKFMVRKNLDVFSKQETLDSITGMLVGTRPVFNFTKLIYYDPVLKDFIIGTEIELKASTNNNFAETNGWVYWGDTLSTGFTNYTTFTNADYGMTVYYADYTNTDSRAWKKFVCDGSSPGLTDKIGVLGYVSEVLVMPSRSNHFGQAYSWMTETNTIYWSWRPRGAANTGPLNTLGQALWYPCIPTCWVTNDFPNVSN